MVNSMPPEVVARFWRDVEPDGPSACWRWTGSVDRHGYGKFRWTSNGASNYRGAHRVSYALLVGHIPSGLVIDHLCRNIRCVNPDHLEPVTNRENMRRGRKGANLVRKRNERGVPVCVNGHTLTPENSRPRPRTPRWLVCRQCERDGMARWKACNGV